MNKTFYRQTDTRWSRLPYPRRPYTVGGSGCGLCAVTNAMIEQPRYANKTPKDFYSYMKQWAVAGDGTRRQGVYEAFKHYGCTEVIRLKEQPMSVAWAEFAKGNRVAVFCMSSALGGSKKIRWTSSGHYIAVVGYQYDSKNRRHNLWVKDSGGRDHNSTRYGWMSYEQWMRGAVADVIIGKLPASAEPKPYGGEFPNVNVTETKEVSNTAQIVAKAKELAWAKGTSSNKYQYKGGAPTTAFKKALNAVYPNRSSWGKASKLGASCDVFVGTVVRSTGIDKSYDRGFRDQWSRTPVGFEVIHKTNCTPYSISKDGDILLYKKNKSGTSVHTLIRGNGQIYEAQHEMTYGHVNTSLSKIKKTMPDVKVYRAKPSKQTVTRPYLHKGDKGTEVLKWQKYLNWYFGDVVAEDGIFGDYTKKYTESFQKAEGLTADGTVGVKTVERAKAVRR